MNNKDFVYLVSIVGYETYSPIILTSEKEYDTKTFQSLCQKILKDVCKKAMTPEWWKQWGKDQKEYIKEIKANGWEAKHIKKENPFLSIIFDKSENEVVADVLCEQYGFKKPSVVEFYIREFLRVGKNGRILKKD